MKETRFRDAGSNAYLKGDDFWHESLKDNKDGDILFSVSFRHDFNPNDLGVGLLVLSPNKDHKIFITHARLLADGFELDTDLGVNLELTDKVGNSDIFSQDLYVFEKIREYEVNQLRKNITLEVDYVLEGISRTKVIKIERYQYFPVPL